MSFSPLMSKAILLEHIDREITWRENALKDHARGSAVEMNSLDKATLDPCRAEFLWKGIYAVGIQTSHLRLAWLREWRDKIDACIGD